MQKLLAWVFISTLAPVSQAAEIYQCVENGSVTLSDKPCTQEAEQQKTIHIKSDPNPVSVKSEQKSKPDKQQPTEGDKETVLREKVVGQWHFTGELLGGWEDRTFNEDGSFTSSGQDEFAETTATGSWSVKGDMLLINAKFENKLKSGDTTTLSDTLKLKIKSINETEMVLFWPRYDSSNTWVRK